MVTNRVRFGPIRRIAVVGPLSGSGAITQGIARFARTQADWRIHLFDASSGKASPMYAMRNMHGIISMVLSGPGKLTRLKVPIVNTMPVKSGQLNLVCPDDSAVGLLAADYLADLGHKHMAYIGPGARYQSSHLRRKAFMSQARKRGCAVEQYDGYHLWNHRLYDDQMNRLCKWLIRQPRPLAVWCFNDTFGLYTTRAANQQGLHVPEEIAVLGTDDEPVYTGISVPPLSSIDLGWENVGYQAAARLHELLHNHQSPLSRIWVAPKCIIERASTDVLSYDDVDVVAAMRHLRRCGCERGITPAHIARHVNLSRSSLEKKFAAFVGHSVDAEIWRLRTDRVQKLLRETDWTLAKIAVKAGFRSVAHLCRTIKSATGLTPSQYRQWRPVRPTSG